VSIIVDSFSKFLRHFIVIVIICKGRKPAASDELCAKDVCTSVGYLPLAMVIIAGHLKKYRSVSFQDYLEELVKNRLEVIDFTQISDVELATRHDAAIKVTLKSQWDSFRNLYDRIHVNRFIKK
jgi:tartrate dehydratase beta subunit/fumarate hydratase class I family protein